MNVFHHSMLSRSAVYTTPTNTTRPASRSAGIRTHRSMAAVVATTGLRSRLVQCRPSYGEALYAPHVAAWGTVTMAAAMASDTAPPPRAPAQPSLPRARDGEGRWAVRGCRRDAAPSQRHGRHNAVHIRDRQRHRQGRHFIGALVDGDTSHDNDHQRPQRP